MWREAQFVSHLFSLHNFNVTDESDNAVIETRLKHQFKSFKNCNSSSCIRTLLEDIY